MNKIYNGENTEQEKGFEDTIRPKVFEQFIGQAQIKESLSLYVKASVKRGQTLDHVLFYGAPGLGKTTLSNIVANEIGTNFQITSGAVIQKPADLITTLMSLGEGDVLFIDEIHRLPKPVEEFLYSAMEDFAIDTIFEESKGNKQTVRVPLNRFTLIGATTRSGMISAPLRDRFGIDFHLEYYNPEDLKIIAMRTAKLSGSEIDDESAFKIAKASRGTPRIVNRIVRRSKDVADMENEGSINIQVTNKTFRMLQIDDQGLGSLDRKILKALTEFHKGQPVGISTLAISVEEDAETIETVHEPFLIQQGLVERTPRGRKATEKAMAL